MRHREAKVGQTPAKRQPCWKLIRLRQAARDGKLADSHDGGKVQRDGEPGRLAPHCRIKGGGWRGIAVNSAQ